MSTDISAPIKNISVNTHSPFVVKSCILSSPLPPPQPTPQDEVFVPLPPSVIPEDLPQLDVGTQIIDTSPSEIIGCANILISGGEQDILNEFFPGAIEGDGVINRVTNDIWVYRSLVWQNVGPTPGPQVVVTNVIPPWNEIISVNGRTKTLVGVTLRDYALQLLTNVVIKTKTALLARAIKVINSPVSTINLPSPDAPIVRGGATSVEKVPEITSGTEPPVLGDDRVNPSSVATNAGWTLLFSGTTDEGSTETTSFGFTFVLNGISYTSCFVNSNCYLTFGGQQNFYSGLGASNPSLPKIHVGSGDFSCQRIYVKAEDGIYRIRWEGNTAYNAPVGSSNRFAEITFYEQLEDGSQYVEVRSGDISGSTSGPFMIATETTALATGSFATNQSWVFVGNSTGTVWTLETGSHINILALLNLEIPASSIQLVQQTPELETGLNIKPTTATIGVAALLPIVATGNSIAVATSACQLAANAPSDVGYRAYVDIPVKTIATSQQAASVSSGGSLTTATQALNVSSGPPSVSTGAAIAVMTSSLHMVSSNEITAGSIPWINIPATTVELTPGSLGVSTGKLIASAQKDITVAAHAPAISIGRAITAPAVTVTISGTEPVITVSGDYWADWAQQNYAWDADTSPDWWAN